MMASLCRTVSVLLLCAVLAGGCMEPPMKEPTVSVSEIAFSDISLRTMTINTTVLITNPNPVGATLDKVAFDVYYLDDTPQYLGHGEYHTIDVKENATTPVTIPVSVGTVPAFHALTSFAQKGTLTLLVNGSAFIDLKLISYEKPFKQTKMFEAKNFEGYLPGTGLSGGSVNVTEKLGTIRDFLTAATG